MLIAEIGWNFLGNLKLAYQMINEAKKSGATHVKFQIWNPKYLKKGPWDKDGRREIYTKAQITTSIYKKLLSYSEKKKIKCFVSICTLRDLKKIKRIQNDYIKIPSMESYNHKLINYALDNFEIVILSAGALKKNELISLKKFSSISNFFIAHCVSSYPMKLNNFNFNKFIYIKENFKNFGYSGHYDGIDDAIYALSNGAKFIEKHFTIDKNLPGRDNKFALMPNDFRIIKNYMKKVKLIKKKSSLDLLKCEEEAHNIYRGRWS